MPPPHLRYPTTTYVDPVPSNYHPYQGPPFVNPHPNNFFFDHPTGRFFYKNDGHNYEQHQEYHHTGNQHHPHQQQQHNSTSNKTQTSPDETNGKKQHKASGSTSSVIITEVTSDDDELTKSLSGEDKNGITEAMRKASIKKDYVDAVSINEADDVASSKNNALEKL
jgi:hypothetical protein